MAIPSFKGLGLTTDTQETGLSWRQAPAPTLGEKIKRFFDPMVTFLSGLEPRERSQRVVNPATKEVITVPSVVPTTKLRLPFAKEATVEMAPDKGILKITADVPSRLLELVPKFITQTYQNGKAIWEMTGGRMPTPLKLPFDARRLGFDTPDVEDTGTRLFKKFDELQQLNPPKNELDVWKNATLSGLMVVVPDALDALVAGSVMETGAKIVLKETGYDPRLERAMSELGFQKNVPYTKDEIVVKLQDAMKSSKTVVDYANVWKDIDYIGRKAVTIGEGESPLLKLNSFGQKVQDMAKNMVLPLETRGLGFQVSPIAQTPGLPGYMQKGFGLSIDPLVSKQVTDLAIKGVDAATIAKQLNIEEPMVKTIIGGMVKAFQFYSPLAQEARKVPIKGDIITENTPEQIQGGGISVGRYNESVLDKKTGEFITTPKTSQSYRKTPFDGVPEDILKKIKEGGGSPLSKDELKRLGQSLAENGYDSNAGTIVKSYGGEKDVILGTTKINGQMEYIVAGIGKNGKVDTVRLHATPLTNKDIISLPTNVGPSQLNAPLDQVVREVPPATPPPAETGFGVPTPEEDDRKLIEILNRAKRLRVEQESIYHRQRTEKLARAVGVSKTTKGEAGLKAEFEQLAGAMDRVEMESIRDQFGATPEARQEWIDRYLERIKINPTLEGFENMRARRAFAGLFDGILPTKGDLLLLEKVIPDKVIDAIIRKISIFEKLGDAGIQIFNLPRALMASGDFSFSFRQGLVMLPSHPVLFARAFGSQFKYFFSDKAFQGLKADIAKDPTYAWAVRDKLAMTDMGKEVGMREEQYMSSWAEHMPGENVPFIKLISKFYNATLGRLVRASGRAYTGMATKLRFDVYKSLVKDAQRAGRNLDTEIRLGRELAETVNTATGRGGLWKFERAAVVLNSTIFSPRLLASRLALLNPWYYIKADSFVRKERLRNLFGLAGLFTTIIALAKIAGAEVGTDSNSSDYGKIKIGNTRLDFGAGFLQYIVAASRMISGKYISSTTGKELTLGEGYKAISRYDIALRLFETKTAPVVSLAIALARQQTYTGEKVKIGKEVIDRFIPMVIQDARDIWKDDPTIFPLSALGVFGVGLQTYAPRPAKSKGKSPVPSFNQSGPGGIPSFKGLK